MPDFTRFRCRDLLLDYANRTLIMGALNVTPDSFSDGGLYLDPERAVARAKTMIAEGAHIIDVGGESARPGADPVDEAEERRRVLPVVEALASDPDVVLSVDTYKPNVARECLKRGARIINDITGLRSSDMARVVAKYGAGVVVMHMQGEPKTMQRRPTYDDTVTEVIEFLERRTAEAEAAGVPRDCVMVDPGIGFGKTRLGHNLELLRNLGRFRDRLPYPLMVGTSRKSFLGAILDGAPEDQRLEGTASSVAVAISRGANAVRVHDVAFMAKVARVADHICHGRRHPEGRADAVLGH